MRIALFSDIFYPELSGLSDSIITVVAELTARGHQVTCFAPYYTKAECALSNVDQAELNLGPNFKVHRLPAIPFSRTFSRQARMVLPYLGRSLYGRGEFDIVHTHTFFGAGLDALWLAHRLKVPLVGTNHTRIADFTEPAFLKPASTSYLGWYYNHCQLVSVPSNFLQHYMEEEAGVKVPVKIISNPIAQSFFDKKGDRQNLKAKWGLAPFTIIYVGRFSPEKNVEFMLESALPFLRRHPDTNLVMVGDGPLRAKLLERVKAVGMERAVQLVGPFVGAARSKMEELLAASEVSVMISPFESQSMSTLQSMAAELPIIGANSGALKTLISADRGLQVSPTNPEELVEALEKLYQDAALRQRLGESGRKFAASYSQNNIGTAWEDLYTTAIEQNPSRHA